MTGANINKLNQVKTFTILTLAAAFWGFQPSCIKWLIGVWSPVTLTACRYFIMSLLLLAWAYRRSGKAFLPRRDAWPWLIAMGIIGILINNVSQFTGLKYTTITNCTLISASSPVIAAVMSWVGNRTLAHDVFERLCAPLLAPIRRIVPTVSGVDLSPLVAILLLQVLLMFL